MNRDPKTPTIGVRTAPPTEPPPPLPYMSSPSPPRQVRIVVQTPYGRVNFTGDSDTMVQDLADEVQRWFEETHGFEAIVEGRQTLLTIDPPLDDMAEWVSCSALVDRVVTANFVLKPHQPRPRHVRHVLETARRDLSRDGDIESNPGPHTNMQHNLVATMLLLLLALLGTELGKSNSKACEIHGAQDQFTLTWRWWALHVDISTRIKRKHAKRRYSMCTRPRARPPRSQWRPASQPRTTRWQKRDRKMPTKRGKQLARGWHPPLTLTIPNAWEPGPQKKHNTRLQTGAIPRPAGTFDPQFDEHILTKVLPAPPQDPSAAWTTLPKAVTAQIKVQLYQAIIFTDGGYRKEYNCASSGVKLISRQGDSSVTHEFFIYIPPAPGNSNNVGEELAMLGALRLCDELLNLSQKGSRMCVVADSNVALHHADGSWRSNTPKLQAYTEEIAHTWKRISECVDLLKTDGHNEHGDNPADALCLKAMDTSTTYDPLCIFQCPSAKGAPVAPRHVTSLRSSRGPKETGLSIDDVRLFLYNQGANVGDILKVNWDYISGGKRENTTWVGCIETFHRERAGDKAVWGIRYDADGAPLSELHNLPPVCDDCFPLTGNAEHCRHKRDVSIRTIQLTPKADPMLAVPASSFTPYLDAVKSVDCPARRWIPKTFWKGWARCCLHVLQAYDPHGKGSEANANTVLAFDALVNEKLKITEGYTRQQFKELKRQLSTNEHVEALHYPHKPPTAQQKTATEDARAVKKAFGTMSVGHKKAMKKTARNLSMDECPSTLTDEQTVGKCTSMHPPRAVEIPPLPEGNHAGIYVSAKTLKDVIHRMCAASAPGPSGMTEELLEAACSDDMVASILTVIVKDIQNNDVHHTLQEYLTTCRLLAIPKPDNGVRPITIGEVLLKVSCAVAVQDVSPHLQKHFKGIQLGLMEEGGCESVLHEMSLDLKNNPSWSGITVDSTNAFNTCHRAEMAKQLYSHVFLVPLWLLFELAYRNPSKLLLKLSDGIHVLFSNEGSRQGCVLGSLLFCLALQPILDEAQEKFPTVKIRAVIDDISIWGPTEDALECFLYIKKRLRDIGLYTNKKTTALVPSVEHAYAFFHTKNLSKDEVDEIVTITSRYLKTLGGFVSRDEAELRRLYAEATEKHVTFFRRLELMPPNHAFPILQACGAPRMSYLSKVAPTNCFTEAAVGFDKKVLSVLEHIADSDLANASEETKILLQLPLSLGGAGIPSIADTAPILFAATGAASASRRSGDVCTPASVELSLREKAMAAEVDGMGSIEKAHRRANMIKHSTAGLLSYRYCLSFPPVEFSAAFRYKFAIPEGDEARINQCEGCKGLFSKREFQEHRISCARLKGVNVSSTHHAVVRAAEGVANRSAISCTHEPKYYGLSSQRDASTLTPVKAHEKGPDTAFRTSPSVTVDWKTVCSSSKTNSSSTVHALVTRKTERSTALYAEAVQKQREILKVPVILQSGGLHTTATELIHFLIRDNPTADFATECATIVVAQQRSLARILLRHAAQTARRSGNRDTVESATKSGEGGPVYGEDGAVGAVAAAPPLVLS